MDLLICPACKQSVLEDDAAVCPFCGAAMDGSSGPTESKPAATAKPAAQKPAQGKKPKKSAAQTAAAPKAAAQEPAAPSDPFAIESQASKKAIPLRRKPTAKASYRVVCPMCDSNGFGTKAVAGKEVKCPNPKCLMPVFTAPEIKKEPPPPPPKPIMTPMNLAIVGVLLVATAGFAVYQFVLNDPAPDPVVNVPPPSLDLINVPGETSDDPQQPEVVLEPKTPLPELQATILEKGIDSALQRTNNRSKDFCRVLNAGAFAVRGQLDEAYEQLRAFDKLGSRQDFMKIAPLCQVAWYHLEQGDQAASKKVADQAFGFTSKLPRSGDDAVQQTVILSTLLIALGEHEKARELIATRESVQDNAQVAARISMVIEDRTYNLARIHRWLPPVQLESPLAFAATYGATVRGYEKESLEWIGQLDDANRKGMCLAGYAAGLAIKAQKSVTLFPVEKILAVADLPALEQQRALGLAIQVLGLEPGQSQLSSLQERIEEGMTQTEIPAAATLPDLKRIYEAEPTAIEPTATTQTQTHLLLARSLAQTGQSARAWKQIQAALERSAATGVAMSVLQPALDDLDRSRIQIESQLAGIYGLSKSSEKRAAYNQYRKHLREYEELAQQRLLRDRRIVKFALKWQLAVALNEYYQQQLNNPQSHSNLTQVVEAEFVPELVYQLNESGEKAAATALVEKWPSLAKGLAPSQLAVQMQRLLAAGRATEAHEYYRKYNNELDEPLLFVRVACQLAAEQSVETVVEWNSGISDILQQELAYRLTAAQLTHREKLRDSWNATAALDLAATNQCSLNLGLMEGLSTTTVYDEQLNPPPTDEPGNERQASR